MRNATGAGSVSLEEARKIVLSTVPQIGIEQAGIINAFSRTLAEPVTAETPVPGCDTASTAGYAVISDDTLDATNNNPRVLSIVSEYVSPGMDIEPGTTALVKQGDPLPAGANAVIAHSSAFRPENGPQVMIMVESKPGDNVRGAGAVISAGETVLGTGAVIGGKEMGLLASLGMHGIAVRRKPRVGIITTGTRVAEIIEEMSAGETRNSTRYFLVGMVLESGCELGRLAHVKEGRLGLEKALASCAKCDTLILALSPEDKHDAALQALRNAGEVSFERVHIEPGSACAYGEIHGKPVFIIPSEAALEAYEALIRPGLLQMLGRTNIDRPKVRAKVQAALKLNPGYCHYIKAAASFNESGYTVTPLGPRFPGTRPWSQPNSLIIVQQNIDTIKRGDDVETILLGS